MTETSLQMARKAISVRNAAEAIAYLKDNPPFRTLKDILIAADKQKMSEMELKRWIVDGFCAHHPEKKRDAIERTIRNWFSGKTRAISRNTAFELCLILKLPVEEANNFMMRTCDEAIHWRNPQEIVWGYAFEHGLTYAKTQKLLEKVKGISPEKKKDTSVNVRTHRVSSEVMDSLQGTEEELLAFIQEKQEQWGSFHNEAYALYNHYMNLLELTTSSKAEYETRKEELEEARKKKKEESVIFEEKISVDDILSTYFFSKWVSSSERREAIHKSIRANWPDATVLSKMRNRTGEEDVSRKVLILLFLATNGDGTAYRNRDDDQVGEGEEKPKTREQFFRNIYKRINLMLTRCGFQCLDPRSPFDWIVLSCISTGDDLEIDRRLEEILAGLFWETEAEDIIFDE